MPKIISLDLDNTIIFSDRRITEYGWDTRDFVNVESTPRGQSYIHKDDLQFLRNNGNVIVANTARNYEQFHRLYIANLFDYAIIDSGTVIEGDTSYSLPIAQMPSREDYRKAQEELNNEGKWYSDWTLIIDDTRTPSPNSRLYYTHDDKRLYVRPAAVNKGTALQWLALTLGIPHIYAFGDSFGDIPMLKIANVAFTHTNAMILDDPIINHCEILACQPGILQGLSLFE